ncbi:CIS tube protein [Pectobacterium versatile]|uniref:CIS tube protein n=1 Tax=Pectobacterium versatile TaxID=2488639 RepID=UPI00102ED819|nr:peptidoglycan-binding protein [Pectobacterium versatile]MCA6924674.1 peptidoglycan-binding protein [Pectobacterium versatile]MCH5081438.1 peptidoglycan-binding protein [Pectobacterium versatile]TAI81186.1 peptidoglycan-binding protein [Pectobacterium versatile]
MEKITIKSITSKGSVAQTFSATLNPNSIKHNFGISYTNSGLQQQGDISPKTAFKGYESEKLDFELLLDGTGVTGNTSTNTVQKQLSTLKKVTYAYNGEQHEPYPVVISWGSSVSFRGRLTSININYSLFDSSGNPLRATVSLSFTKFLTQKEKSALKKQSSPDLTHMIEFKAGDTLPMLCHKIYNDSSYYLEVARANHLISTRQIKPGTRLYFPPLI